jgi:hypothetical protein
MCQDAEYQFNVIWATCDTHTELYYWQINVHETIKFVFQLVRV